MLAMITAPNKELFSPKAQVKLISNSNQALNILQNIISCHVEGKAEYYNLHSLIQNTEIESNNAKKFIQLRRENVNDYLERSSFNLTDILKQHEALQNASSFAENKSFSDANDYIYISCYSAILIGTNAIGTDLHKIKRKSPALGDLISNSSKENLVKCQNNMNLQSEQLTTDHYCDTNHQIYSDIAKTISGRNHRLLTRVDINMGNQKWHAVSEARISVKHLSVQELDRASRFFYDSLHVQTNHKISCDLNAIAKPTNTKANSLDTQSNSLNNCMSTIDPLITTNIQFSPYIEKIISHGGCHGLPIKKIISVLQTSLEKSANTS
jgi:hypothetical protein